ncbi:epidermal retinol dehydrogenase 2 isoform X1 [Halyomorpha halys]|uniref:epidermal retinol dehydrogenase 2 isoform X1 n=2 Tax=Halyomorpha halys TaxID=286706 RepID=UPI0006D51E2D|nr:epidermal retinol dehydrogenase 2-like [Halyomorpha halys]
MAQGNQEENMMTKLCSYAKLASDIVVLFIQIMMTVIEGIIQTLFPKPLKSVKGEIVLVTGAGHGIGREIAIKYAELGSIVVCLDINEKGNEETVKLIQSKGFQNAHAYKCDVTKREVVLQTIEQIKKDVGDVTVLINNAGIMPCHHLLDHKPQEIIKMFEVNVFAHFWLLEAVLPNMIEKNHGHIVALSSIAGISGLKNLVPYCASKFAVRGMMESLMEEFREEKIASEVYFTVACPYMVNTGLCKNPKVNEKLGKTLALLNPESVAEVIVTSMRQNKTTFTIPSFFLVLGDLLRLFPVKVGQLVKDFLDSGMNVD